jgi:hypothetical protein
MSRASAPWARPGPDHRYFASAPTVIASPG